MQIFKMLTCFIIQYKKLHLPDVTRVNQKQSLRSLYQSWEAIKLMVA